MQVYHLATCVFAVLGVCYGAQYLALQNGGNVAASDSREYGRANLTVVNTEDVLLKGMTLGSQVWMSHGDTILDLGVGYEAICSTGDVKFAGFRDVGKSRDIQVVAQKVWRLT